MASALASFFKTHALPPPAKIALAVSGGADSFALLHMAFEWAGLNHVTLAALTVDHQLRPESRIEAETVAQWCLARQIPHEILTWREEKPLTGIQEAARIARRDLLCRACQRVEAPYLLLGHQADDQAETMLMRLQRGSGLNGLKAIEPVTRDPATGVTLLRPLLDLRRTELRAYCQAHQLPFIDDPSNENNDFERVQIRETLGHLPKMAEGAAKTALRLRRANDTLNQLAETWISRHASFPETGHIWLPETLRSDVLPEISLRVLHSVLNQLRRQRLSVTKLEKLHDAMRKPEFKAVTMAGCWIRLQKTPAGDGFLFQLEPPRRT